MLKKLDHGREGLEFSSPARGCWNIVHTGMMIPQSHQIFVCAQGCLRGVVLTAAEMNAMNRYSAISIREENVLDGSMEELMIEGVADVLQKLDYKPKAVLLFISCQHFFLAYDQRLVFQTLQERYPDIAFVDCYMIPTLRKSGITPDQRMRKQMYALLQPAQKDTSCVNIIGSNLPLSRNSELYRMLNEHGITLKQLGTLKTYDEYLSMAASILNIIYEPIALIAGEDLKKRLDTDYLYLPCVFSEAGLEENYEKLSLALGMERPDLSQERNRAKEALISLKELIGETPVAVDYTFTFRILSFTRMLLEHGIHVTEVYIDMVSGEEEADYDWIAAGYPDICFLPTNRPRMRLADRSRSEKVLAVGQKAAYFTGSNYFVNVAEGGGYYGYEGIVEIVDLMKDAFLHEKDMRSIIQKKGYGCESCL